MDKPSYLDDNKLIEELNQTIGLSVQKTEAEKIKDKMTDVSDDITQQVLKASKLFQGRISLETLEKIPIPRFRELVDNEIINLEQSQERYNKFKEVDAYSRDLYIGDMNRISGMVGSAMASAGSMGLLDDAGIAPAI